LANSVYNCFEVRPKAKTTHRGSHAGRVEKIQRPLFTIWRFFGPGWRMYYVKQGKTLIVMLGGGNKDSQESDIAEAKQRKSLLED